MLKPQVYCNKKKSKVMKKIIMDKLANADENSTTSNSDSKKPAERVGDWTCQRCFNHNFAFRDSCNMCHLGQQESMAILNHVEFQREEIAATLQYQDAIN